MNRPPIEDQKTERTALKKKVTTITTRLSRAIKKDFSPAAISAAFAELESAFLDFTSVDEEYAETIKEDERLRATYAEVNDLDLDAYTASVEASYDEAKEEYKRYQKTLLDAAEAQREEVRLREQTELNEALKRKIRTGYKIMRSSLIMVEKRQAQGILESVEELEKNQGKLQSRPGS